MRIRKRIHYSSELDLSLSREEPRDQVTHTYSIVKFQSTQVSFLEETSLNLGKEPIATTKSKSRVPEVIQGEYDEKRERTRYRESFAVLNRKKRRPYLKGEDRMSFW